MTPDEKKANVKTIYNIVLANLFDAQQAMKRTSEDTQNIPKNKHTIATLDELIGHLQERREKKIKAVK